MAEKQPRRFLNPPEGSSPTDLTPRPDILRALDRISGKEIEQNLLTLARVGGTRIEGTPQLPERYAVNRIALSIEDSRARETVINPLMEEAGMQVLSHPFASIGVVRGKDPSLDPIVILSHTDSVPNAGMYDGPVGVIGGIAVVKAMREAGMQPQRSIIVLSLTGEESSGYDSALFGSRGIFLGLTDKDLDAHKPGGPSIKQSLNAKDVKRVKRPIFGDAEDQIFPAVVLELHVDQNGSLEKNGSDVAVVEAIASPERHQIVVGNEPLKPDTKTYPFERYYSINVAGKADHSGATPMGPSRADGLVVTANLLRNLSSNPDQFELGNTASGLITIGDIEIDGQALNKIPGDTKTAIRITARNQEDLNWTISSFQSLTSMNSQRIRQYQLSFGELPISLAETTKPEKPFFAPDDINERQLAAMEMVREVNFAAFDERAKQTVGTIGTYTLSPDGTITLGMDVRGIDMESRDNTIKRISQAAVRINNLVPVDFGNPLPGSGEPTPLNSHLTSFTYNVIRRYNIGKLERTYSPAGHDAQSAARAGFATAMIFCQSNAGGISHHPDEYTNPKNLEKGVKALAAVVMELAA